jgi:hypothetical protein
MASTFRHLNVTKYLDNTCKLVIILLKANLVTHVCLNTLNNAHLWLEQSCTIGYTYKAIVEVIRIDLALNGECMKQMQRAKHHDCLRTKGCGREPLGMHELHYRVNFPEHATTEVIFNHVDTRDINNHE